MRTETRTALELHKEHLTGCVERLRTELEKDTAQWTDRLARRTGDLADAEAQLAAITADLDEPSTVVTTLTDEADDQE
jgi:hypothetical protein